MLDRAAFLRPIAHRGLHAARRGVVENTLDAFAAAKCKGYGIECDVRPTKDSVPVVFHDEHLDRLTRAKGLLAERTFDATKEIAFRNGGQVGLPTLEDLFATADGQVPVLIEIKSEWLPPDRLFVERIAVAAAVYHGPVALMSFDPAVMVICRETAPDVPRGIVSGLYRGTGWWDRRISRARADALANLRESGPVAPDFYAYDVQALPTTATTHARGVEQLPLFTWTVRSPADRARAHAYADAMIFEGFEP